MSSVSVEKKTEVAGSALDGAPAATERAAAEEAKASLSAYAILTVCFILFGLGLASLVTMYSGQEARAAALLGPLFALATLIALVWTQMLVYRNFAAFKGIAPAAYYLRYSGKLPPDWVERPARAFNNLMQIPLYFCVVCLLMMVTERLDAAQLTLAWVFVATRVAHAVVYIVRNHLPSRFGLYVAGVATLAVILVRFAIQSWDLIV